MVHNHAVRTFFGPLFLMAVTPPIAILAYLINKDFSGSIVQFIHACMDQGFFNILISAWKPLFWGNQIAWTMIVLFSLFQILLMRLLPGKQFKGPLTPKGNTPIYKANGILAYGVTLATFLILSKCKHIIMSSGNCSLWTIYYRGNADNIYQYLNDKFI